MAKSQHENSNEEKYLKWFRGQLTQGEKPKVFVFISLLTPESVWLSLSEELEKVAGIFVLIGAPKNSFKTFSKHISKLEKKGVNVPILINPALFREYRIKQVPTFVIEDNNHSYKVSDHDSLFLALDLILTTQKSKFCTLLKKKLQKNVESE